MHEAAHYEKYYYIFIYCYIWRSINNHKILFITLYSPYMHMIGWYITKNQFSYKLSPNVVVREEIHNNVRQMLEY